MMVITKNWDNEVHQLLPYTGCTVLSSGSVMTTDRTRSLQGKEVWSALQQRPKVTWRFLL